MEAVIQNDYQVWHLEVFNCFHVEYNLVGLLALWDYYNVLFPLLNKSPQPDDNNKLKS